MGQAGPGFAHSPTPADLPAGSTNPKQTETRDFGFIWIDIFIYLWHNFFEVGWFYSKEGPKLSYPGDWLLKSLFSPSAPAHPDSAPGPLSTSLTLSPEPFFSWMPVLVPQVLVLNPLLVSLYISHLVLLAASTAAHITCLVPGTPQPCLSSCQPLGLAILLASQIQYA